MLLLTTQLFACSLLIDPGADPCLEGEACPGGGTCVDDECVYRRCQEGILQSCKKPEGLCQDWEEVSDCTAQGQICYQDRDMAHCGCDSCSLETEARCHGTYRQVCQKVDQNLCFADSEICRLEEARLCDLGICKEFGSCGTGCNPPGSVWPVRPGEFERAGGNHPVVTDRVTGLMWQGCLYGQNGDSCESGAPDPLTWLSAIGTCKTGTWANLQGWYLPGWQELMSIYDYDSGGLFPEFRGDQAHPHWSSASTANQAAVMAWILNLASGGAGWRQKTSESLPFRCVRNPNSLVFRNRFQRDDSDEPVVRDQLTGLEWQGCTAGWYGRDCSVETGGEAVFTHQEGEAYCQDLSWSGHRDWRLPDIRELVSTVDDRLYDPPADPLWFPNTPGELDSRLLSSSWSPDGRLWVVYSGPKPEPSVVHGLGQPQLVTPPDSSQSFRVRCVRDQ